VWQHGAFAFCTGSAEQQQRNLEANPHVAVTTGSTGANGGSSGKDAVVEGAAMRVTDAEELQRLAAVWFAEYGEDWRFEPARSSMHLDRGSVDISCSAWRRGCCR
jgi:hypothetical protein